LRVALSLAEKNKAKTAEYLARIEHEAQRLEELIAQLLAAQAPGITFDRHIDLVGLLQELCSDANFEGESTGKTVELSTTLSQAVVSSSGDLLKRSFENVLRNALTHTADNSAISLQLQRDGDFYQVTIADSGGGVPEADIEKIFGEFYRIDSARSRETGGYGLGLAIAKRAIEQHRGSIRASNTASGLAVTVKLPVSPPDGLNNDA